MTRYIKNLELPAKNETEKTTWKIFKYGDPKVKLRVFCLNIILLLLILRLDEKEEV